MVRTTGIQCQCITLAVECSFFDNKHHGIPLKLYVLVLYVFTLKYTKKHTKSLPANIKKS